MTTKRPVIQNRHKVPKTLWLKWSCIRQRFHNDVVKQMIALGYNQRAARDAGRIATNLSVDIVSED
jgi:hypothetical protein